MVRRYRNRTPVWFAAATVALTSSVLPVLGQQVSYWSGNGGSNDWTDPANWSGGVVPSNDGTAFLQFAANSARPQPNTDVPWAVQMIYLGNGSPYTLTGSPLSVSNVIQAVGPGYGQTVNNDLVLTGSEVQFSASYSTALTIGGQVTGAASLRLSPSSASYPYGPGQVTIAGPMSYAGATTVDGGGTVSVAAGGSLPSATPLTVSGSTINFNNAAQSVAVLSGSGTVDGSTTLSVGVGDASGTFAGTIGFNVSLAKVGGGTWTLSSAARLTSSNVRLSGGTLEVGAAAALPTSGTVSFDGGVLRLTAAANVLSVNTSLTMLSGGGTLETPAGVALTVPGTIGGTGPLTKQGAGSLVLTASNTNSGPTNILAGTVSLGSSNRLSDVSPIMVASGATLDFGNNSDVVGGLAVSGTTSVGAGTVTSANAATVSPTGVLRVSGGTFASDSLAVAGNLQFNSGTINVTGAGGFTLGSGGPPSYPLTLTSTKTLTVASTAKISEGAQFTVSGGNLYAGSLSNAGSFTYDGGNVTVAASLTNAATGRLFVALGRSLEVTAAVTNAGGGRITLQGGAARLGGTGPLTNAGLITGDGEVANDLTNAAGGELRGEAGKTLLISGTTGPNAGTVNLLGGTVEFSRPLTNGPAGSVAGRGTLIASAGVTNNGQMSFSAGLSDVVAPVTNNGRIVVSGGGTATFYNPVTHNAGGEIRVSGGSSAVFLGPVTGPGAFTGSGTKYFEAGSSSIGTLNSAGSTVVQSAATLTVDAVREPGLAVYGTVAVRPAGTAASTSVVSSLAIDPAGTLDLADNALVIDYAGLTPADAVRQLLLSGRGGSGAWTGAGIRSSAAAADPQHRTALAWAEAATLGGVGTFAGQPVDATAVLLKYTWYGDANLDGKIDADDFALIDRGMAKSLTGWVNGDFNYDNAVNAADYLLIDRVYVQQSGTLSPTLLAEREARFGDAYVADLIAAVPEPACLALAAGVGSLAHRSRRRR